ncbi:Pol-like protein [Elysia marginata]|uniref:Pol-like protein n=1 Tax=Elysia marginata TaxID=1093978 RepID=A0AAV4FFP4_9GAST|nr:Pol-like protein [Elysia marginata]
MLLVETRHVISRYASRLKKDRSAQMRELEKALQLLHDNNEEDTKEFITKKEQLETVRSKLMEGVLIRSRARWVADREKMSKYFLNLEKKHFAFKTMTSLIKEDGTEIIDYDEMISEVRGVYNRSYENRDDELKDIDLDTHLSIDTPRLSDEEAQTLKGKITLEVASKVL